MPRGLSAGVISALARSHVSLFLLVEAEFKEGVLRLFSGTGELLWNGEIWYGAGDLLRVSDIETTQELASAAVTYSLSGLSSTQSLPDGRTIYELLDVAYQGRPIRRYLGIRDIDTGAIIDVVLIGAGLMDVMGERDHPIEGVTVEITAHNYMWRLSATPDRHYTAADQKATYPDDTMLDQAPLLVGREIEVRGR